MHVGQSWSQKEPEGPFDAIVIGSGIGGLAAAAVLARHGGKKVLVLERHYRAGGYTHSFSRAGYDWDVGVHDIGQAGTGAALRGAFDRLSDGRIEWAPLPDVFDRIVLGDRSYDLMAGRRQFIERMTAHFPARPTPSSATSSSCAPRPVSPRCTSCRRRCRRALISSPAGSPCGRGDLAARTTHDVLRELTKNEALIAVLTGQYGDDGLPPGESGFAMHAALVSHYLGARSIPSGGPSAWRRASPPLIEEWGGHIADNAEVRQIVVEKGRAVGVRMADAATATGPVYGRRLFSGGFLARLRFSIVTPAFNQARFIKRTIDSVLSQTGDFDLTYRVFDGGSTDGTVEILRAHGERLLWTSEPDNGQVDAINKGLRTADADIIGWVNSDDTLLPGALARVAAAFVEHPKVEWVHGRCLIIDEDDRPIRGWVNAYKHHRARHHSFERLLTENYVSQMTVFWRREAMDAVGLLDESLDYAFDYDLWLRLARRGPPLYCDEPLACFRWYETSKSGANYSAQFREDAAVAARYGGDRPLLMLRKRAKNAAIVGTYRAMGLMRAVMGNARR